MKRIDDKIKEIKKKDRTNRWLFYGIIVLIIGFLFYASTTQKKLDEQAGTITLQEKELAKQLADLEVKNKELEETISRLEKSQTPIGFWNQTEEANSATSYLNYIMHTGKPEAKDEYRKKAIENIQLSETEGKTVWLFGGEKSGDKITKRKVFDVVYRLGEDFESNDIPIEGDIVENVTMNRNTYRNYANGNTSGANNANKAWNKSSKALILQVEQAGDAVFIKIKF